MWTRRIIPFFFCAVLLGGQARADTPESPSMVALRQAADAGDVNAQNALADAYFHGTGLPKNPTEAIRWWRKAADKGSGEAYSLLGTVYYQGIGVPKDSAEAVRFWQKAAEMYDLDAMSQLGFAYLLGDALPRNFTMAYMWFNLAASNGDTIASKNRDSVAQSMSAEMVQEAQQLGTEWLQQHPKASAATGTAMRVKK
ncbi:MAG: sel1 repeat family protein [Rickettsiales bacterium]|nr:sel1 repeat family protein [Rickettsiales bacterium]